jgi:RHS repeat-associated protein
LFPRNDGNLTSGGVWTYTYDAENRLISMVSALPANQGFKNAGLTLSFTYDYMNRRVEKKVINGSTVQSDRRYIYNGQNLVAEIDATTGNIQRSYTWGLDLAGSLGATGGVGALLEITNYTYAGGSLVETTNYFPEYDGNGNVTALVRGSDGMTAAVYEYGPFGEMVRNETFDQGIADNPFKFSTKFMDLETGLVDYGNRYYSPSLGRFINRDPIEEAGGLNLYGFCGNDGIDNTDYLGQSWLSRFLKFTRKATRDVLNEATLGTLRAPIDHLYSWGENHQQELTLAAAIVASIVTYGAASGWAATELAGSQMSIGATWSATTVGAISGAVGGAAAGAVSGVIMTGTAKGALQGAASGALFGGIAGYFGMNPAQNISFKTMASQVAEGEYAAQVDRFARRQWGINGMEFDGFLEAASFLGNAVVGNRLHPNAHWTDPETGADESVNWVSGILSRNYNSKLITEKLLNRAVGLGFDAVDIVLGFQGIPTATDWSIIVHPEYRQMSWTFHSLGTLGGKSLVDLGVLHGGILDSLVFGNIAPSGLAINLSINDPVGGSYLGMLLNWNANMISLKSEFGPFAHNEYPGIPP